MNLFEGLFDTSSENIISVGDFLLCVAVSLIIGVLIALIYAYKSHYTKSFIITLGILPAIVCIVIMMVNGNIGIGVAVAGAFSLVRFRSVAGSAREIAAIFLAMATGLVTGMGYLAYALLFTIIIGVVLLITQQFKFTESKTALAQKTLRITIPEDLNYEGLFEDVFEKYTTSQKLISVKTSSSGSVFKLKYDITKKADASEKQLIDDIRVRNGNLEVAITELEESKDAL